MMICNVYIHSLGHCWTVFHCWHCLECLVSATINHPEADPIYLVPPYPLHHFDSHHDHNDLLRVSFLPQSDSIEVDYSVTAHVVVVISLISGVNPHSHFSNYHIPVVNAPFLQ